MSGNAGGCLCGKVRYKVSSLPVSQGICYCLQCQKTGGAYGSPMMVLQVSAFDCPRDSLSSCLTKSARGSTVRRNFCKVCGTHIFAQISDSPSIVTVKTATLDDFSAFKPEYLVWTRSAIGTRPIFPSGVPMFSENAPLALLFGSK